MEEDSPEFFEIDQLSEARLGEEKTVSVFFELVRVYRTRTMRRFAK
jgi:hypothetical protein